MSITESFDDCRCRHRPLSSPGRESLAGIEDPPAAVPRRVTAEFVRFGGCPAVELPVEPHDDFVAVVSEALDVAGNREVALCDGLPFLVSDLVEQRAGVIELVGAFPIAGIEQVDELLDDRFGRLIGDCVLA